MLVSALLALHLGVRHGLRLFAIAALPAVVPTAILVVVPCLYFGSWTVWQDWYHFVSGATPRMLVRPIESGNASTPLLLSSWLGGDVAVIASVMMVGLGVSFVAVIRRGDGHAWAARAIVQDSLRHLFDEPRATVAIGILLTMATAPLSWGHDYVLLLIPSPWLLNASSSSRAVPALAAASVIMSSAIAGTLLWGLTGWAFTMVASITLSWVPLWGALLIALRSRDIDDAGILMSNAAEARRPRRRRK